MHRFVLIDLWSKIEYIPLAARRCTPAQFLDWFSQYGWVREYLVPIPQGQSTHVYFKSLYGPEAQFAYHEPGNLLLIGDHWVYRAWLRENAPE